MGSHGRGNPSGAACRIEGVDKFESSIGRLRVVSRTLFCSGGPTVSQPRTPRGSRAFLSHGSSEVESSASLEFSRIRYSVRLRYSALAAYLSK